MLNIAQQVGEIVNTNSKITNLKRILEEKLGITTMSKNDWNELVSLLERYYEVADKEYPFAISEELQDI